MGTMYRTTTDTRIEAQIKIQISLHDMQLNLKKMLIMIDTCQVIKCAS